MDGQASIRILTGRLTGDEALKSFLTPAYGIDLTGHNFAYAKRTISIKSQLLSTLDRMICRNLSATSSSTFQSRSGPILTARFYHHGQEHLPGPALQRGHHFEKVKLSPEQWSGWSTANSIVMESSIHPHDEHRYFI